MPRCCGIVRLLRLVALVKFGRFSRAVQEIADGDRASGVTICRHDRRSPACCCCSARRRSTGRKGAIQPEPSASIPRALWWAIITLTTVGYGDVSPITPLGKFLASMVALGGIALVAMPTGIIAAAFSEAMQRRRAGPNRRSALAERSRRSGERSGPAIEKTSVAAMKDQIFEFFRRLAEDNPVARDRAGIRQYLPAAGRRGAVGAGDRCRGEQGDAHAVRRGEDAGSRCSSWARTG